MREGIGSIFLYNIIIVFIVITFAFLAGIMSYNKAFKVNSRIVDAIERGEGYNNSSIGEINRILQTLGYRKQDNFSCPIKDGKEALKNLSNQYNYCVHYYDEGNNYYSYGVLSYMYMDLPIIGKLLRLPIYTRTDRLYLFSAK